jgi:hypothetical protein
MPPTGIQAVGIPALEPTAKEVMDKLCCAVQAVEGF